MDFTFAGFQWDDGNWPKCAKHGVSKVEIEFALSTGPFVGPDRGEYFGELRYNAVGRNEDGRCIFVVFSMRELELGERLLRPISARYMHAREIERYERQVGA